ncbi:MAG: hypothetical protein LBG72_05555 [Spirochaetaceae bacterium]|jgi:predicted transcriptional regulator|nr:hypothetical protein [Spirochaetaceae bacterium]
MKASVFAIFFAFAAAPVFLTCTNEIVDMWWGAAPESQDELLELSMPIGSFTGYKVTTGTNKQVLDRNKSIGFDAPMSERVNAVSVWSDSGDIYFEYLFPAPKKDNQKPKELTVSFEACSEFNGSYKNDYLSDITIRINGIQCAIWNCPGDLGERAGKITPPPAWLGAQPSTRYGMLAKLNVSQTGTTLAVTKDGVQSSPAKVSNVTIDDLNLDDSYLSLKISVEPDAVNKGGINLFGSGFGDYPQDILLSIQY